MGRVTRPCYFKQVSSVVAARVVPLLITAFVGFLELHGLKLSVFARVGKDAGCDGAQADFVDGAVAGGSCLVGHVRAPVVLGKHIFSMGGINGVSRPLRNSAPI